MSKWMIDKQFDFCYGHRVWSQKLEGSFCESGDTRCKCRHLHGHQGKVHVFLESEELERGMVTDFKHLGWLKNFLDDNLDHKFILDLNDPLFDNIVNGRWSSVETIINEGNERSIGHVPIIDISGNPPEQPPEPSIANNYNEGWKPTPPERFIEVVPVCIPGTEHRVGYNLNTAGITGPLQELYGGIFIVNFLPTSENLAKWIFDGVNMKMKDIGVNAVRVDWFETPKSRSSYRG